MSFSLKQTSGTRTQNQEAGEFSSLCCFLPTLVQYRLSYKIAPNNSLLQFSTVTSLRGHHPASTAWGILLLHSHPPTLQQQDTYCTYCRWRKRQYHPLQVGVWIGSNFFFFLSFLFYFRATCEHQLKHKTGICFDPAITYGQKEPCAKMFPEASFVIEKDYKKKDYRLL